MRLVAISLLVLCWDQAQAQVPQYSQPSPAAQQEEEGGEQTAVGQGHLRFPGAPYSEPNRLFLNRDAWQGYVNYGTDAYETYTVSTRSFEIYDRLGHRLLRGYPLATWEESRSGELGLERSGVVRAQQFWQWFDSLIAFQDSYNGWDLALLAGDKQRTTLTPLTLHRPRWDGIRLDGQSSRNGFTLLLSRGQERRFSSFQAREEVNPVPNFGGRWYSKFGGVLTTGLTFFNQHEADLRSSKGNMLRGTVPVGMETPTRLFVRVQDDSPEDASPAQVYGLDLTLEAVRADGTRFQLSSDPAPAAGSQHEPSLLPAVTGRKVGDHWEAQGTGEAVDFEFALPAGVVVERARFAARVGGDYRIGVRQTHQFFNQDARTPAWEERQWPARPLTKLHNLEGRPDFPVDFKPTDPQSYYTLVRAEGNPAPGAPRQIGFAYGFPVGQTLVGADFQLEARQVVARGELVYNRQDYQFPFNSDSLQQTGEYFGQHALAGYLTVVKKWGPRLHRAELGMEIFRLDPDYSGGYDSRRGGSVLSTDVGGDFEVSGTRRNYAGFTQEYELVADNDDRDDWSDDDPGDEGNFQPLQPQVYSGAKAHSGVFPGLDADGDNAPDTDRNRNGVADWNEAFLLYGSDPPEFVYGIDFNNNGVADFRENDAEADYPYRRDSKGFHGFTTVPAPLPLVQQLGAGFFSMRQLAGEGKASGVYARLKHRSSFRGVEVEVDDDLKLVRDSIRDNVYIFDITASGLNSGSILDPPPPDPLLMRKSLVNTAYVQARANPRPRLHLQAQLLHQLNRRAELELGDGTRQAAAVLGNLTGIGRIDYACTWHKFDLWAGLKAQAREGEGPGGAIPDVSVRFLAPILRVSYPFMTNVTFQWGVSGFRWLPMRYVDNENRDNSYKQRATVLMINSFTGDYLGYSLSTSIGAQWQEIDFDHPGAHLDSDTVGIFVETFAGF